MNKFLYEKLTWLTHTSGHCRLSLREQTQQKAKSLVLTCVSHLRLRIDTSLTRVTGGSSSDHSADFLSHLYLHSASAASKLLCPPQLRFVSTAQETDKKGS